jgi:hypothetical protein
MALCVTGFPGHANIGSSPNRTGEVDNTLDWRGAAITEPGARGKNDAGSANPTRLIPGGAGYRVLRALGFPFFGRQKWDGIRAVPARTPVFAAASPYADPPEALAAAGVSLAERGAQALLLDCIGFIEAHREQLAAACSLPVILSNALMAKIAGELVAG